MTYNPQTAKEQPGLPTDTIFDAIIIDIKDGIVKDFVKSLDKWKGEHTQPCIDVTMEVLHKEKSFTFSTIFTYENDEATTVYAPNSNLGKFKTKYNELPVVGSHVKVITDKDGFLKLKLD